MVTAGQDASAWTGTSAPHPQTGKYAPSTQWTIIRRKGILVAASTWVDLEGMALSETSPSQEDRSHMVPLL